MGLFDFKKKKDFKKENVLKSLKPSVTQENNLNRLTKEGDLPFGWVVRNSEFTGKISGEFSYFLNTWLGSKNKSPKELYSALRSLIMYLESAEKICKSKGECYEFWFYECLISRDYIEKRKAELKELSENLDNLSLNYEKRVENLVNIDAQIVKKLKENPNILQSNFVKLFDSTVQADVREKLYWMEKHGSLERIKSGRSYLLKYKNKG